MEKLRLTLKSDQLKGEVKLSGSKSISNRLLIMRQLSGSISNFSNLSVAQDTTRLAKCLHQIETCSTSRIPLIIDTGNAGTVLRFLTAFLSIIKGKWLLTGEERMKNRPVGGLVDALNQLGADICFTKEESFPPLLIQGSELYGDQINVDASKSSQFVSALMMIAPYFENGLIINLLNKPVSYSYIEMTANLMKLFGVVVQLNENTIAIQAGDYQMTDMGIEPDWSSASYWYEVVALSKDANIFLPGFMKNSVQGDHICAQLFEELGVSTKYESEGIRLQKIKLTSELFSYDFTDHPDLVPAIMATCAAKQIPATFYGVSHLKYKESDRLRSLNNELSKIGAKLEEISDGCQLIPAKTGDLGKDIVFETYADHRIAMCLAPLAIVNKSIDICDPDVVVKSYPEYWSDLKKIGLVDVEKL